MNTSSIASFARRVQLDVPLQIAVVRLQLVEERDALGDRHDEARAKLAEIFQQIERVGAVAQDMRFEFEMQVPASLPAIGRRQRRRLGDLSDRSRPVERHEALEVVEDALADDIVG